MPENAAKDLSKYRFERAEQMLRASKVAYAEQDWVTANNRAYYCFFHAMRAVLALDKKKWDR